MPRIYALAPDGSLRAMEEAPYPTEDLLQRLLADHPDLLAGDQMSDPPRRWLLVSREVPVPDQEGATGRWSLDHLLLDQEGVPTLVEVKRSADSRIRREVVGQMLDYAANAVVYWPVESIRARFEARCAGAGLDPAGAIAEHVAAGPDADGTGAVDAFWSSVKSNLQAGRVRLVFVADVIPPELRRIVEFLNDQMDPAEVLAVEVRQFVGGGLRTLVPRVVGQTAASQQRKGTAPAARFDWTETTFFARLREERSEAVDAMKGLYDAFRAKATIVWGKGPKMGSFSVVADLGSGAPLPLFSAWTSGVVEMQLQYMRMRAGLAPDARRRELVARLNAIPGVALPEDSISRRPSFPVRALGTPAALSAFEDALAWAVGLARAAAG